VRVLLKRGAKNSEKNNKGITPLHYACSKNTILNILCAELLVLNGANVNAKTDDKEVFFIYLFI
jgi:ankyrin repeat protein